MTFLCITCRHLEVADGGMTAAVKRVLAQPLGAGAPSLVCQWMGDGMLSRRAFAQRGPSACSLDLRAQLLLARLVLRLFAARPDNPIFAALFAITTPLRAPKCCEM